MIIESALKEKGFGDSLALKKEFISLSLYCILMYDNSLIDTDYEDFRAKSTSSQFALILTLNPINPAMLLSTKTQ